MHKIVYIVLSLLFAVSQSYSQQSLSLEQSRNLALKYNHLIKMAREDVLQSQFMTKAAFTNFLPKMEGKAQYNYMLDVDDISLPGFFLPTAQSPEQARLGNYTGMSDVYFPGVDVRLDDLKYHTLSLTVMQPVFMGGKIQSGYKMARMGEAISVNNQSLQKSEVIQETDNAYWNLVSVKEKVLLAKRYRTMLKGLVNDLQNAFELELITRNEVLKAQVQLNKAELEVLKAQNGFDLSRMSLCQVIGRDLDDGVDAADSVIIVENKYTLGDKLTKALYQRPELNILAKQVQIAGENVKVSNSDFMPQLVVGAGYNYTGEVNGLMGEQGMFSAQASLTLPVFHWKERRQKVAAAKAQQRKSELQLERSRDLVVLEVKQSFYKLQESNKQIELAITSMNQAEENVKLTQDNFYQGLATTTELLDAQAFWQRAYSDLIDAKINYKLSETAFLKSIGELGVEG